LPAIPQTPAPSGQHAWIRITNRPCECRGAKSAAITIARSHRAAKAETGQKPKDFQLQRRVNQCRQQRKNAKLQYTADDQGPASQPVTQQTRAEQAEQQPDIASR
jgi:hypothetical protein